MSVSSRWSLGMLPDVLQCTGQPCTARSNLAPKTIVGKLTQPGLEPHAALNLGQLINSDFLFHKMMIMTLPSLQNLEGD